MQHPLQVILTKQWASHVKLPVWLMSPEGNLVYYNESAEIILGLRYEVSGEIVAKDLEKIFKISNEKGESFPSQHLPISIALKEQKPIHKKFKIRSLDGSWKWIESTALPLISQDGQLLGAISIFWEVKEI